MGFERDQKPKLVSVSLAQLLMLLSVPCNAEFRGIPWGASPLVVIQIEGSPVDRGTGHLTYKTELDGYVTDLGFLFDDRGRLNRGGYSFPVDADDAFHHVSVFERIQTLLEKSHGKPDREGPMWTNSQYEADHEHWGRAISIGHLIYFAEWDLEDTEIRHFLHGDNYDVHHTVFYHERLTDAEEHRIE